MCFFTRGCGTDARLRGCRMAREAARARRRGGRLWGKMGFGYVGCRLACDAREVVHESVWDFVTFFGGGTFETLLVC